MKKCFSVFFLSLFFLTNIIAQQKFPSYFTQNDMEFATPGTVLFGLNGFDNPAELSFLSQANFYFTWNDKDGDYNDFDNWGLFTALPNLGFSINNQKINNFSITDYKLSAAIGTSAFGIGLGYGWSRGAVNYFNRSDLYILGAIYRPANFLSFSFIGNLPISGERQGIIGAGIRPFGNYRLTLFADYVFTKDQIPERINWSTGIAVEPLDGLRLIARYFEKKSFNVGIQLGFGMFSATTNTHFNEDAKKSYNTYGIRIGADDRNLFKIFQNKNNYVSMDLQGELKYQRFRLFDNSKTLFNLIEQLNAVKDDNSVSGIVINISGMNINREMLWEIRQTLKEIKSLGKKIYIYMDRAGMDEYHFASIADKIILDPMGTVSLNGYLMGRTFFKGTLEKIGLGFNELRYFKYKSAAESYSRDNFSEADREQRQRLVDENYRLAQEDICEERNFSHSYFNKLVDSSFIYLPADAIKLGLVDTLERWSEIQEVIKKYEKGSKNFININSVEKFNLPDDYWGEKPAIAVIYAIGGTSMDDGIKARTLVKYVEAAFNNNKIKAIVLRVDSPGGDALAADLIADIIKKNKGKKPVIVSQGYVAASGGYWLSMNADTIVAAPNTITGSIGVIGSFIYNKTLKQNLGMSVDHVQKGKFADLGFGATLPLLGITIPDRDLTETELKNAENGIKILYREFVSKVASARKESYDDINKVAQGRVWAGSDGIKKGLIDLIGGLETAIKIALEKSNLTNGNYEIVEMPARSWFDLNSLIPAFLKFEEKINTDPFMQDLNFRLKYNGIPMPMLPLDFIDQNMTINEE